MSVCCCDNSAVRTLKIRIVVCLDAIALFILVYKSQNACRKSSVRIAPLAVFNSVNGITVKVVLQYEVVDFFNGTAVHLLLDHIIA